MGMRKALVWEQPCFAASPQEGASSHQTAAAAGRCQMQMRCSRKDAESMDSLRKAWLDKSFLVLFHQRGHGGWKAGVTQVPDP